MNWKMKELLQKIGEIMGIYTKKGDRLRGNKIECNARKNEYEEKISKDRHTQNSNDYII